MKPNIYAILVRAIGEGIVMGWNRAHKHNDKPSADHVMDQIENEIFNMLHEVFTFDDDRPGDSE